MTDFVDPDTTLDFEFGSSAGVSDIFCAEEVCEEFADTTTVVDTFTVPGGRTRC